MTPGPPIDWSDARGAIRLMCRPLHLRRTALTAVIVGTLLFVINHLDTVLAGDATTGTWVKIGLTYLVPFGVANVGLLLGTRR